MQKNKKPPCNFCKNANHRTAIVYRNDVDFVPLMKYNIGYKKRKINTDRKGTQNMERKYLSGSVRERLQDLMKERKITQSELATKIEIDVSTLSRFISKKTDKLGDENIKKIAKEFGVSTDFLLGVTDIPDRMNYDIAELGLSVQAAKNLYTGKVNAEVINRLLENKNFAAMTNMIAHYFDDTLAAGYAAQNQMYATLSALLMGEAKQHPEDREAITEAVKTVSISRMPMYQADLTAIQNTFLNVLKEIKKEIGSDVSDAQTISKEAAQQMYAELTKGQDVTKPNVTPEMIAEAIIGSVSGMDGVAPEALKQFNEALIGLFTVKPTDDEHDDS